MLDQLLEDRAGLAKAQTEARRAAENTYCWEREAPRLLEIVNHALDRSSP
jgi:hypothetical protein